MITLINRDNIHLKNKLKISKCLQQYPQTSANHIVYLYVWDKRLRKSARRGFPMLMMNYFRWRWTILDEAVCSPGCPQPEIFDNFNNLISKLSAITQELHQTASGLDPVFSSIDIASLRLADIPEEEEVSCLSEELRLKLGNMKCSVYQVLRQCSGRPSGL